MDSTTIVRVVALISAAVVAVACVVGAVIATLNGGDVPPFISTTGGAAVGYLIGGVRGGRHPETKANPPP